MKAIRLAIITSHPIQYNAPLFRLLSKHENFEVKVFYSWEGSAEQNDPEFGRKIAWDIPLLEGYEFSFVDNKAGHPGTHHFFGLNNPSMVSEIEHWKANAILIYGWAFKTHLNALRYFYGRLPVFFRGDSTLLTGSNPVRRFFKKPALVTKSNSIRNFFRRIFLSWVYRHVDVALYPGEYSKKYFLFFGLPLSKLYHVPHAVDNRRFSNNAVALEVEALHERKQMGIPDGSLVLLFAGKFVPHKQPTFFLQAVIYLVEIEKFSIDVIMVGEGALRAELMEQAAGKSYIHFLGFRNQSEMPLVYRLGDVYVLPSSSETWGLGVNEAMACSRPVLVSDKVGCAPNIVVPNVSGDMFVSGSMDSIKSLIRGYFCRQDKLFGMRRSARKLIECWSIDASAKMMGECIIDSSAVKDKESHG